MYKYLLNNEGYTMYYHDFHQQLEKNEDFSRKVYM